MLTFYQNLDTGNTTVSREEAIGYYLDGAEVMVFVDHGNFLEQKELWIH